jgi:uncharacterized protein (UPF0332 family)
MKRSEIVQTLKTVLHAIWNTAINRLYYTCYHAVTALLTNSGIEAQNRVGVHRILALYFTKTEKLSIKWNKFYAGLFENRQTNMPISYILTAKQ